MAAAAAAALLAVVEVGIAYFISPAVALALPFALAAGLLFLYRPMAGVYAGILAVPLEVLNLSFGSFGLTPSKAIFLFIAGLAVVRFIFVGRAAAPHVAYLAFGLGLVVSALGVLVAQDSFLVVKLLVTWSAFLVISMLVATATPRQVRAIMVCLAVAGGTLALQAVATGGSQELQAAGAAATNRASAAFTHPNQLAFFLVLTLSPALVLAVRGRPSLRLPMLAIAGLTIAGLMLTLTRGAIVGAAASLVVLLAWVQFRRFAALLLFGVVLFAAINGHTLTHSKELSLVSTRLSTIKQGAQTGGGRVQIWRTTPRIIAEHFALGVGAGNFSTVSIAYGLSEGGEPFLHAHDVPLTIAAERGVLALALFAWFAFAVARAGVRAARHRQSAVYPLALGLTAGLFGLFVNSLTDYPPGQDAVMATIMVEVGALLALERHMREETAGARRVGAGSLAADQLTAAGRTVARPR
jgi:O-antigen ligase